MYNLFNIFKCSWIDSELALKCNPEELILTPGKYVIWNNLKFLTVLISFVRTSHDRDENVSNQQRSYTTYILRMNSLLNMIYALSTADSKNLTALLKHVWL